MAVPYDFVLWEKTCDFYQYAVRERMRLDFPSEALEFPANWL